MAVLQDLASHVWNGIRDILPSSSYATSAKGLTWKQVIYSPLPPYLSPLPVIFRILAYLVISPALALILLDVGGYLVFRIYDQPFWSGTRTAFYKFKTSPVFTRSSASSPTSSKNVPLPGQSQNESPVSGRETSLSPVSSSTSLMGMNEENYANSGYSLNPSDIDTSPSSPNIVENASDYGDAGSSSKYGQTLPTMEALNRQIQRRHRSHKSDNNEQEEQAQGLSSAFNLRPDIDSGDKSEHGNHSIDQLRRSNSLGLGLHSNTATVEPQSEATMFVVTSPSQKDLSLGLAYESAKGTDSQTASSSANASPNSAKWSGSSSRNLEEDDKVFDEAKQAVSVESSPSTVYE